MSHLKDQQQTALKYAHNLVNTGFESIKIVVPWTADYFTHKSSYYPVVEQATPLDAIPKMSHRRPMRQLNTRQKDQMTKQASDNGRAVRQRSVRQETTSLRQGHFLSICNILRQRKYFSLLFLYFSLLNLFQ